MQSFTRLGTRPLRMFIILLSIAALAVPFMVFADELISDADELTAGWQSSINFGDVCLNDTVQRNVTLALQRTTNGDPNIFRDSSSVTVERTGISGDGLSVPQQVGTISLPSSWSDQSEGDTSSDTVTSTISFIPTSLGAFTGSVSYRASGTNNHNKAEMITRDEIVSVSANVIDCTPSTVETEIDANDATGTYGGSTDLSATLTAEGSGVSGKDIDFTLNGNSLGSATTDTNGVATLENVSLAGINAGSYPSGVGASFPGDSTHDASSGTASLTVNKADQTIDFGALANKTYGDPSFDVSATASSGLPVSFSTVSSLNVCSIDGNTVTIEGAGQCTIRASQGGDVNYNAAPNIDQTFTVDKATATLNLDNLNHTYDGNPKSATVTTNPSGLSGITVTYDGSTTPPTDAGEYHVVASLSHPSYQASNASDTLVIGKASATISLSDLSHIYDGNVKSATATTDPEGLDTVTVTYDGSADLPVDAGSYSVEATLDNQNYTADPATGTLVIDPNEVTGSFTANNKEYDGTTDATVASSDLSGVVGDDDVTLVVSNAHFDSTGIGTGKAVTADLSLLGDDADNYALTSTTASTNADITAKNLTISGAVAQNKVYDGSADATVGFSGATLDGVVPGDDVSIDSSEYAASFDDANVGSGKPVTVSGVSLSGDDAGNYTVSQPSGLTADITEKNLTISGAVANDKVYDGNTTATADFSNASLNGVVGSDDVSIDSSSYSASFADANVADGIAVTVTGVTLSGAQAGNYTVSQPSGLSADITPKTLTITGAVATGKTYDGNAMATVDFSNASLEGVVDDDDVEIDSSRYSASFADKTVDTDKPVTVSGVGLSGDDARNYSVSQPTGLSADITAREITGSFTVANKVYDGNTDATITGRSLDGVIGDDDVALVGGTATFEDANVGDDKTVTGTGFSLDGDDAGNYLLSSVDDTTANITAKQLTGSFTAADKTYDGNTSATVASTSLPGVVGSDDVTLDVTNAQFNTKDVGPNKTVSADLALSGADAGNYELTSDTATTQASISPLDVTASFTANNKVYDGTTDASVNDSSVEPGFIGDDNVDLVLSNVQFEDKNAGTGKTVTTDVTLIGDDAFNYSLTSDTAETTADITALEITGSFTVANKVYDGTTAATIATRSLNGVISGDEVQLVGGTATFDDENVGDDKTVNGSGFSLSGDDVGNYTLASTTLTTTADISPMTITGSFTAADKTYDGITDATVTSNSVTPEFIDGDDVELVVSNAHFDDANAGDDKTVTADLSLSGEDAGNYQLSLDSASTTANITKRPITITADDQFKLLGDDDPELTYRYNEDDLVEGDEVTVELTREPGEDVGTYQIQKGTLGLSSNYNLSFEPGTLTIGYNVCVDFENDKVYKAGRTIPVRIALCDIDGNNVSSESITVKAMNMTKIDSDVSGEQAEDSGNANPDNNFRYAGGRYIYNLSTKHLRGQSGEWELAFSVDGVHHDHYAVTFQFR